MSLAQLLEHVFGVQHTNDIIYRFFVDRNARKAHLKREICRLPPSRRSPASPCRFAAPSPRVLSCRRTRRCYVSSRSLPLRGLPLPHPLSTATSTLPRSRTGHDEPSVRPIYAPGSS